MLTINTELFSQLVGEAAHLTAAHWDEVESTLHGEQHYTLDQMRYANLERLGMLHISAARGNAKADCMDDRMDEYPGQCSDDYPGDYSAVNTKDFTNGPTSIPAHAAKQQRPTGTLRASSTALPLAGYAAFTLVACPHRPHTLLAALDGLYLAPWARGGLSALRLLRHAEASLAERGVSLVQYSSPASRPCHALYRRLGAQLTETIWHKPLTPQQHNPALIEEGK